MQRLKRGDSLIEVLLAMTIFSAVAVSSLSAISFSIFEAQADLEITMARNELDAQAEALRFIRDSYVAAKGGEYTKSGYKLTWEKIKSYSNTIDSRDLSTLTTTNFCDNIYEKREDDKNLLEKLSAFAVNPRILGVASNYSEETSETEWKNLLIPSSSLKSPSIYPRLTYHRSRDDYTVDEYNDQFYTEVYSVEGIYVVGAPSDKKIGAEPEFYDFYIGTCWYPQGRNTASNISTTIRVYNPDAV